jgi:hypothetical protein
MEQPQKGEGRKASSSNPYNPSTLLGVEVMFLYFKTRAF